MKVTEDFITSNVPAELQSASRWVCWTEELRDGKKTKIPLSPVGPGAASVDDPETWADFRTAHTAADLADRPDGIGFVFVDSGQYVGFDLDDCRDPDTGDVDDWARDIVESINSYTEVSPSGTGLHIIARGEHTGSTNRKNNIEVYDQGRYFTVSGDQFRDYDSIRNCGDDIDGICDKYLDTTDDPESTDNENSSPDHRSESESVSACPDISTSPPRDKQLIEKAKSANNGDLFTGLWEGDSSLWGEGGKYDSQSEADLALCNILAFWTGKDAAWMDQLFRKSRLMRPKWDKVHYADGCTYGDRVIEKAIARVDGTYSGTFGSEDNTATASS